MNNVVKIDDYTFSEVLYKNKRVVTFEMIDAVHKRVSGTAKRTFNAHKNKLIENEDYYIVKGQDTKRTNLFNKYAATGILITESGYLLLVKPFSDEKSWEIQRKLVKFYFRSQKRRLEISTPKTYIEALEQLIEKEKKLIAQQPKVDFAEAIEASNDAITIRDFAKILSNKYDIGEKRLFKALRTHGILMKSNKPYQRYINWFNVQEKAYKDVYDRERLYSQTLINGKGQLAIETKVRQWTN